MPVKLTTLGLSLFLCLFLYRPSFAQITLTDTANYTDLRLWLGIQYEHTFSKAWKLKAMIQTRLDQRITMIDRSLGEVEILHNNRSIKFLRPFTFGVGFRVLGVNDVIGKKQGLKMGFRAYGLLLYQQSWKRWDFGYRLIYQDQSGLPRAYLLETDWTRRQTLRNRLSVGHNIKNWKLDPEIQAELFYQFNEGETQGFNAFRLGLGTSYKISKQHKIKLRLLYEQSIGLSCIERNFIVALNYEFSTETKKKKKKKD